VRGSRVAVLAIMGALVAAVILAGCGSDSSSGASTTAEASAPLSKAQFVKQADETCRQGLEKKDKALAAALEERAEQTRDSPTPQETAKLVEEAVLPSYRKTVDQLSQLGAPKGDEAGVEKMIGEYETALQSTEAKPAKAINSNPFEPANKAAGAYGIEECSL
jgi:hypothetical protein